MKYKYLVVVHEEWYPSTFLFEDETSALSFYKELHEEDKGLLITISEVRFYTREGEDVERCIVHCGRWPSDAELQEVSVGNFMENIKNA